MSDIVERLRALEAGKNVTGIMTEAADEIERLREALSAVRPHIAREIRMGYGFFSDAMLENIDRALNPGGQS